MTLKKKKTMNKEEYILCAAIWFRNDIEYPHQPNNISSGIVVCGQRHHNCFNIATILDPKKEIFVGEVKRKPIQGFLTSKNRFVGRDLAGTIAFLAGQIKEKTDCLFSEDLY